MHNWFTCKVTYEKVLENGMQKKVTEPYLVDALSFTEAEARIIEEIRPFVSGEFVVSGINRAHFGEVFSRPRRNDCRPAGTLYRDTPARRQA